MVPKRFSNELDNDEPESSKRQLRDLTFEEIQSFFEPIIRKTVREVVENLFHVSSPSLRGISDVCHAEVKRDWMLRFVNQPPPKLFTGNKLEDMDGALLQVEIVGVDSKALVLATPMSSLKLELVVLPGDFDADQHKDLGEKYFDSHVLLPRQGKKPLVTGDAITSLKNGVGFIRNVRITDNSRWTKSAKFRLGVRVLQRSCKGFRVREAVSDAFKVRDRRGEACMKHSYPSKTDEVWRLKKIIKNGIYHQRLKSIGIATVGDFLQMLEANPITLKETLKCGNSNRTWNTIVEHALSHDKEQNKSRKVSISHYVAGGVTGTYPPDYNLQLVADDLEGYTSNFCINQIPVDVAPYCSVDLQPEPLTHPSFPLTDIYPDQHCHGHELGPSSSNYYGINNQMENPWPNPALLDAHQVDDFVASLSTWVSDDNSQLWFMGEPSEMQLQQSDHHTLRNPVIQSELSNWPPNNPLLWRQLSANFSTAISESDIGLFSSAVPNNATPRTAWCKLRATVIWRILIRQMQVVRAKKGKSSIC